MANNNTYSWSYPAIDVYPVKDGNADVVYNVHWFIRGTDPSEKYSVERYGVQGISPYNPDSGSFIPYDQLTKEIVTTWVISSMGERFGILTSSLDADIDALVNPKSLQLAPPWNTPTPSPTYLPPPSYVPIMTPTPTPAI